MPENQKNRPIQQIHDDIKTITKDVGTIKSDIEHIKKYIRQREIREQLEKEREEAKDAEYVKPSKSWFNW